MDKWVVDLLTGREFHMRWKFSRPLRQPIILGIVSHLDLNDCRPPTNSEPSLKLIIVARGHNISEWYSRMES